MTAFLILAASAMNLMALNFVLAKHLERDVPVDTMYAVAMICLGAAPVIMFGAALLQLLSVFGD